MEAGNYKDSLNLLDKSLAMTRQLKGNDTIDSCAIYSIIAKVHIKQKDYEAALKYLQKIETITSQDEASEPEALAGIYLQIAKVFAKRREDKQAIQHQEKALDIFEQTAKFHGTDFLAGVATQLSTWQEQAGQIAEALVNLGKALDIYKNSYGMEDIRTCKIKRNVALVYLRGNQFEEALRELREVEELERVLYGEASSNLAKTQKIIGTLMIITGNTQEAREYLVQAHAIFEQRGMLKQLRETKQKLKMLQQAAKQTASMLVQSELSEIAQNEANEKNGEEQMSDDEVAL